MDETLSLIADYMRLGVLDEALANDIVRDLAEEKASAWHERQQDLAIGA